MYVEYTRERRVEYTRERRVEYTRERRVEYTRQSTHWVRTSRLRKR